MICVKCDKDLARCTCDDLEERFNQILASPYVLIGAEYQQSIRDHIQQRKSAADKKGKP